MFTDSTIIFWGWFDGLLSELDPNPGMIQKLSASSFQTAYIQ